MITPKEMVRLYKIVRVFLHYGLDDIIPKMPLTRGVIWIRKIFLFWIPRKVKDQDLGERLRRALQELGPVWIKLGQMLSTRRDLFPEEIITQLEFLQDKVAPFDGKLARELIENEIKAPLEKWFSAFNETPLASGSIAQVHTALLNENNQEVVIKVIRPDILPIIQSDIQLMHRLALWLPRIIPSSRHLRPKAMVKEYEKSLLRELDLLHEAANGLQLARNFTNSPMLYIPKIYSKYCRKNILVMERIYGISVTDLAQLRDNGTNFKLLAERGLQIFFKQVFQDSFFHADMHPGNVFVSSSHADDPQYITIDFGIVGFLNKEDKRYLAENILAFFNRDYQRVAELHVDSGWVAADTDVNDFAAAIRMVCEPIFQKPLSEISFAHVLVSLFNTVRQFDMEVQPQLLLLEKTLLYIEGIGRQLYPQLDLWITAKPYLEGWMKQQVGLPALIKSIKEKLPHWVERFPELPEVFFEGLAQQKKIQKQLESLVALQQKSHKRRIRSVYLLGTGAILLLSATILHVSHISMIPSILSASGGIILWCGWRYTK